MFGAQDAVVNDVQHQRIDHRGAEFLLQVERQRRAPVLFGVVEAQVGIQPDDFQRGAQAAVQQGVAQAEQGVDGIARRAAVAIVEAPGRIEHGLEDAKIGMGGGAFHAQQGFQAGADCCILLQAA